MDVTLGLESNSEVPLREYLHATGSSLDTFPRIPFVANFSLAEETPGKATSHLESPGAPGGILNADLHTMTRHSRQQTSPGTSQTQNKLTKIAVLHVLSV